MKVRENKRQYNQKLYTVKELAEFLSIDYYTVIKIINRRELTYINLNKGSGTNYKRYRISDKALQAYIKRRLVVAHYDD